ncbi:MAG: hypothetical protein K8F62_16150 [Pseudorhodoplanes sp.]|nr:hypothetical protein [Pseudorhodoplanes sp.]
MRIEVDIDEMKLFATRLLEYADAVRATRQRSESDTEKANDFWRDKKYQAFRREQEKLWFQVQYIEKRCEMYSEYLREKARRAEDYLYG